MCSKSWGYATFDKTKGIQGHAILSMAENVEKQMDDVEPADRKYTADWHCVQRAIVCPRNPAADPAERLPAVSG